MAVAVPLRSDFDAAQLRALAKRSRDPDQTRRLLALAAIYDGASRTEAAQIGCVTVQIVPDWVLRFNARGPEGLLTGRAPGAPPRLTDQHRQALQAIVDQGPIPAIHGVVRWRLIASPPLGRRPTSSAAGQSSRKVKVLWRRAPPTEDGDA